MKIKSIYCHILHEQIIENKYKLLYYSFKQWQNYGKINWTQTIWCLKIYNLSIL